mgnify:CR=1 FL=1
MTRNIIFDFGNVLVRFEPELVYTEYFGDEARAWWFLRHVADLAWRTRMDAGEPTAECVADLQRQYPDYQEAIALYDTRYFDMLTGEVEGMRSLLGEMKAAGYNLYGLTNWSMETFPEARRRFAILQIIDRYVVSAEEKLVKPDPRLFQVLLDRYGLRAEECIFVDDNPDNVAAACQMGIEGIVFCGADKLKEQLL